jgi:C-terminal processing protease CtpA/Prc
MAGGNNSYKKIVRTISQLLTQHYSYLSLRESEFEKATRSLDKSAAASKDDGDFLKRALVSLSIMRDLHIRIVDENGKATTTYQNKKTKNYNPELLKKYFKNLSNWGVISVGARGDLVYVKIDSFADRYRTDFDKFYKEINVERFQKWIIDLRANGGGSDSLAKRLVSQLAGGSNSLTSSYTRVRIDEKNPKRLSEFIPRCVTPDEKYSKRNVIAVLTGRQTYSSAELVAMDLAAIPGTVLIGDSTGGGSGHPNRYLIDGHLAGKRIEKKEAPRKYGSHFALDIPSLLQYQLDQSLLQDRGITPNVFIPASKSIVCGRDKVLEKALEFHKN